MDEARPGLVQIVRGVGFCEQDLGYCAGMAFKNAVRRLNNAHLNAVPIPAALATAKSQKMIAVLKTNFSRTPQEIFDGSTQ